MLSCCPGEDTATQARFVWHSDSDSCQLFCARASNPANRSEVSCIKVQKPVAFRSSDVSYYKYEAEVSNLKPGTEYVYWVESGSEKYPVQRFKTAGTSGSWNFLWMSDVHSHPDNPGKMTTVELLRQDAEARTVSSGGIDLVLFSGDAVKYGSRYDNWQQWNGAPAVTNYTFAMVPGNKEYYYTGSSTFYDYYWYLTVKNNPPNGPGTTEQEGCYWFLRDSVLFVGIDSLIHKGSRMTRYNDKTNVLRDQTNWFDRVVSEQASKKSFRYLVVVQHDPWFVYAVTKDSFDMSRGNYNVWRHVFDKHKVDLALSGDEHNYIRTKPLRGDVANSEGTIYMVAGQIEESNYSATVTTDIASYGNANATKYFDCMGATDASCGACWVEVRPESLKLTSYWDKWQSPDYKVYDTVTITPKDRGFVYVEPTADDRPWLGESAATNEWTGEWSVAVAYDADGRAYLDSNGGEIAFVPYSASTGNVVTVETKAQFCEYMKDDVPGAKAQAAVRLGTNGCFQVYSSAGWVDVEAEGFTPVSGEEYTLRLTFDYSARTYGVEVKTGLTGFTRLGGSFPLAASTNCVSRLAFKGDTYFTSLSGDCRMVVVGFAEDEALVLKDNAEVVLDAAKAAWLNSCAGSKAAVGSAAAGLSAKEFSDAYLLNLDITDGDRSYAFEITGIDVGAESVSVAVTLRRSGEIAQKINGVVKFYGAATLADFKTAASPLGSATLSDNNFSKGDTATATITIDGETPPAFFKAKIEER